MRTMIKLVDHVEQAIRAIREFREQGHPLSEIYVLAHDSERTEELSKLTDTNTIGLIEEGMATAFANLFRSRGEQLRSKMESLGISAGEAERYEAELDQGRVLVLVWHDENKEREEAERRRERPEDAYVPPIGGVY
ncbi:MULTISPECIES: general stress protein [Paenibacillus]|uniref:general stress protein n=1 Tax=Paenibacillus TaxID=44249 RepID=UPI0006D0AC26|nr:general stress protein [Paenibacillus sp. EPM92]